jgi:hypothetical protein
MPVTAKLSRKFYEKFGDELTNELVEWLNQVDATYRSDLRELNQANLAHIDARFERIDGRFAHIDDRFTQVEARLDAKLEAFESRFDAKLARLEGGLLARIGMAEGRLARLTLTFWVATLATLVALLKL